MSYLTLTFDNTDKETMVNMLNDLAHIIHETGVPDEPIGLVDGTGNTIAVLRNHTMTTPIGASCVKHGSVMPCRCFETDPKRNQRTMQAAPWFSALVDAYVG